MPVLERDALAALRGARIVDVYFHEGSPGGHNNDCVILTLESGERVRFDAYAMTGLEVQVCANAR